ncbi:hypothetical protein Celaphus_00012029 [Cervus elaphus hippelaphus]|uniref:Uncharacterized protein n=1 Tax=Cervus elaphus hippelaphus TaxID=46360 RepID=A0A212CKG2_CEREH|nr:hypothetical protein Celaphus_00012029 [Cervus elaphus hippelaphus]
MFVTFSDHNSMDKALIQKCNLLNSRNCEIRTALDGQFLIQCKMVQKILAVVEEVVFKGMAVLVMEETSVL